MMLNIYNRQIGTFAITLDVAQKLLIIFKTVCKVTWWSWLYLQKLCPELKKFKINYQCYYISNMITKVNEKNSNYLT